MLLLLNSGWVFLQNGRLLLENRWMFFNNGLMLLNNRRMLLENGVILLNDGVILLENGAILLNNGAGLIRNRSRRCWRFYRYFGFRRRRFLTGNHTLRLVGGGLRLCHDSGFSIGLFGFVNNKLWRNIRRRMCYVMIGGSGLGWGFRHKLLQHLWWQIFT